jgi:hypothetical protein
MTHRDPLRPAHVGWTLLIRLAPLLVALLPVLLAACGQSDSSGGGGGLPDY